MWYVRRVGSGLYDQPHEVPDNHPEHLTIKCASMGCFAPIETNTPKSRARSGKHRTFSQQVVHVLFCLYLHIFIKQLLS